MPLQVPQQPRVVTLDRLVVGRPASARNLARWNEDALFLTSHVAQPIVSAIFPNVTTNPHSYYVCYRKSPGVKALMIRVEPHAVASATNASLTCAVTASSGTVGWIGSSLWLDGSRDIQCPLIFRRGYGTGYYNFLDVSQLTDGTVYDLIFTITDASVVAGDSRGLFCIHVTEVPLADVDPIGSPTTETGVNPAWLTNTDRNAIVDGDDTTTSYGTERLLNQVEIARYQRPRIIQIIRPENTTDAWKTNTTGAGTAWPFGYASTVTFTIPGRALYSTSTDNQYLVRLRYRTEAGQTNKPTVRFSVQPNGGANTNTTYQLANAAGGWTATTTDFGGSPMTLAIPCSGTDQETFVTLRLWNDSAHYVYVSQVALIENET